MSTRKPPHRPTVTSGKRGTMRAGDLARLRSLQQAGNNAAPASAKTNRREFMKIVGVGGAALGVAALAASESAAESSPGEDPRAREAPATTLTRTLFFNLSHL